MRKSRSWVQKRLDHPTGEKQVEAIKEAARSKVLVITGGPGTGKTTIINAVLKIFSPLRHPYSTGRTNGARRQTHVRSHGS
jgi:exodeoxyribonuclease V alpha subunit